MGFICFYALFDLFALEFNIKHLSQVSWCHNTHNQSFFPCSTTVYLSANCFFSPHYWKLMFNDKTFSFQSTENYMAQWISTNTKQYILGEIPIYQCQHCNRRYKTHRYIQSGEGKMDDLSITPHSFASEYRFFLILYARQLK